MLFGRKRHWRYYVNCRQQVDGEWISNLIAHGGFRARTPAEAKRIGLKIIQDEWSKINPTDSTRLFASIIPMTPLHGVQMIDAARRLNIREHLFAGKAIFGVRDATTAFA